MIPWKFNSQVKLLTNPGSSEVQNHIHNKVKSCEAGQRSCLYKSWTSEVHLIPKYLTNLEVHRAWNLRSRSDLSSTKKKLSSDHQFILRTWSWSFIQLKSTEVKHVSSAFSQSWSTTFESPKTEVKINAHHEVAPKKSSQKFSLHPCTKGKFHLPWRNVFILTWQLIEVVPRWCRKLHALVSVEWCVEVPQGVWGSTKYIVCSLTWSLPSNYIDLWSAQFQSWEVETFSDLQNLVEVRSIPEVGSRPWLEKFWNNVLTLKVYLKQQQSRIRSWKLHASIILKPKSARPMEARGTKTEVGHLKTVLKKTCLAT